MFDVVPIAAYLTFPYVAGVFGIIVTQIVDMVAKSYQGYDSTLNVMKRECKARSEILYRRLRAASVLGFHVYLGGRSYVIKKSFKIEYRARVLDQTVSLMLAFPVDSFTSYD